MLTATAAVLAVRQSDKAAQVKRATLSADVRQVTVATVSAASQRSEDLAASIRTSFSPHPRAFAAVARDVLADPALGDVGLVVLVSAAERPGFERRYGPIEAAAFGGAARPAGRQREYFVLTEDIESRGATSRPEIDLGEDPAERGALLAAAAAGQPRATPPTRLLASGLAGTALFVPIYRSGAHEPSARQGRLAPLRGFVTTGYRYDLLRSALRAKVPAQTAFALDEGQTQLLGQGSPHDPQLTRISLANRSWTLAVGEPSPDLSLLTWILLLGGLLTLLLGLLSLHVTRRERFALEMVDRRISERQTAERKLATAEERFRTAFAEAPIGMALTSLQERFIQVNRALAQITGYSETELLALGHTSELTHPDDRKSERQALASLRAGEIASYDAEKRYLHAAGHAVWVAVHTTLIREDEAQPAYFLSQIEDITARRRYESELEHMADHDPLTGLLNRRAYERHLEEHLTVGERYGHDGAVLVLDLDDFKQVNDTLGHSAGDQLIVRVASALSARLRESDTIARLGGDEFAVLMPSGGRPEAERLAEGLLQAVRGEQAARGPGGRARPISASIGIALLAGSYQLTAEDMLINADLAMYDAKEAGGDRSESYGDAERGQARIEARLRWVERIRDALDEDRFVLHAQPVVETISGRITQHELLVRMVGPAGDLIAPESFLPIAERFGLVREIDRWVVRHAIEVLGVQSAAGRHPTVEINLSGNSLGDSELAADIGEDLRAARVDPAQLIFEVTETTAIGNIGAARSFAERLGELGCRFALDDFGAGFGSFYYLKHLPFDFIKIDGEFVRNCTTNETDQLVIGAVVELAKGMGKCTIAEFVGDRQTLLALRKLGVDYAQGMYIGRPASLETWLGASAPAERSAAGASAEAESERSATGE